MVDLLLDLIDWTKLSTIKKMWLAACTRRSQQRRFTNTSAWRWGCMLQEVQNEQFLHHNRYIIIWLNLDFQSDLISQSQHLPLPNQNGFPNAGLEISGCQVAFGNHRFSMASNFQLLMTNLIGDLKSSVSSTLTTWSPLAFGVEEIHLKRNLKWNNASNAWPTSEGLHQFSWVEPTTDSLHTSAVQLHMHRVLSSLCMQESRT